MTQRASDLRIIQAFQKSQLQLDLATFSRSNSFPLMWLLTEEISFISFIANKARVRHYLLLCTSVPQCILAALVWHFSIHSFKKEERNVLFNHPIKMTTPGTFLKLFKTPTALALSWVKNSSARISYQWTSARVLNVTLWLKREEYSLFIFYLFIYLFSHSQNLIQHEQNLWIKLWN